MMMNQEVISGKFFNNSKTKNMRLFIDKHYFISVLQEKDKYNCQVMELINGMGMHPATINEKQTDVVSSIVYDIFTKESLITDSLQEVFNFHQKLLLELDEIDYYKQLDYLPTITNSMEDEIAYQQGH
jgi:hypothetical protein